MNHLVTPPTPAAEAPATRHPPRRPPWLAAAAAATLAGTLAGEAGALFPEGTVLAWLCDLSTHFRAYALGTALAGLALSLRGGIVPRIAFAASAICSGADLAPAWAPPPSPAAPVADEAAANAPDDRACDVVCLNVHYANRDTERVLSYLRARRADVVVLLEVDAVWADALAALAADYPGAHVVPGRSFEGCAVLSRWPLRDVAVIDFGTLGFPSIVATVATPAGAVEVIATHPRPPLSPALDRELRAHLRAVGRRAAASDLPCLVIGDLNATPWSAAFRGLVAAGDLRDTARGRGVQPTWNARLWAPRIPIDHVLVSPDVTVVDRRVGPDVGSDHLPIEARLRLPEAQRDGASSARSMPSRLSFL